MDRSGTHANCWSCHLGHRITHVAAPQTLDDRRFQKSNTGPPTIGEIVFRCGLQKNQPDQKSNLFPADAQWIEKHPPPYDTTHLGHAAYVWLLTRSDPMKFPLISVGVLTGAWQFGQMPRCHCWDHQTMGDHRQPNNRANPVV